MARIIEPKLRSWYWFRLDTNAIALATFKAAITVGMLNPCQALVSVASVSDDFREATGNNDGLRVQLSQMTVDGKAQKEAWCMAEVMSKVALVEKETGIKSKILATEHCMTLFRHAVKNNYAITNPKDFLPGDIILWEHGETDAGHTGVLIKWLIPGKVMLVAEGNTTAGLGPNGKIVREGGGGYIVERAVGKIGDMNLRGAARPFPNYKAA